MFLAVAQGGTVRAAADALDVNHATIIRGISRLEETLETKLFDRLASGYRLTDAGSDIVELAGQMATASSQIEARIFGRDQRVSGPLRFTLPISMATDLLMPSLADFKAAYPDIALEILSSTSMINLVNREADVALRVVVGGKTPPDNLYGTRLCQFHMAFYIHRNLMTQSSPASATWLLGPNENAPSDWEAATGIKMAANPVRFAKLIRVPGTASSCVGDIWLLTHSDTRQTRRVRLLCDHVRRAIQGFVGLLNGQAIS